MNQTVTQPLPSFYKEVNLEWVIPKGLKILCEPLPPSHKHKIYDSPVFTTTDPIQVHWKLFFNSQTYEEGSHPYLGRNHEKDKEPKANFEGLENWFGDETIKAKKQYVFPSLEIEKINDTKMDVFVEELNVCCASHKTLTNEPEIICEVARGGIECRWIEMRSKNPVGTYCKFAKHSPLLDASEPGKIYPRHMDCDIVYRFKGKLYTGN